jgi:hypothetical protein
MEMFRFLFKLIVCFQFAFNRVRRNIKCYELNECFITDSVEFNVLKVVPDITLIQKA